MEGFVDQAAAFFGGVLNLAEGGYQGVNQVLGLIIAAVAALLMSGWKRLWAMALGAALVHTLVNLLLPVLDGGAFQLPNVFDVTTWMTLVALFLGYAVVIAIFYLVKSALTGGDKAHSHAH